MSGLPGTRCFNESGRPSDVAAHAACSCSMGADRCARMHTSTRMRERGSAWPHAVRALMGVLYRIARTAYTAIHHEPNAP